MRRAIELFSAYLDGVELTAEQSRYLSEWVKEHPQNARVLVMLTQIHESLDSRLCVPRMLDDLTAIDDPLLREEISDSLEAFVRKVEETSPLFIAEPAAATPKPRAWALRSGWAAAAALFLVLLTSPLWRGEREVAQRGGEPAATEEVAGAPSVGQETEARPALLVANLQYSLGARWGDSGKKAAGAEVLQGEVIDLESGIVSLTTTVGHAIVIEGPARMAIESPQRLTIERGKAVGRVGVHGGSLEFSTPTATIRDLGTEFGVAVAEDRRMRVAVYDGAIELLEAGASSPVRLEAGAGRDLSPEGKLLEESPLPHDREFVRLDEVDLRVASRQGDDEAEALATYYKLVRSGKLLAYQDFHAPSRGMERTIGLGPPPLRSAAPVVMGPDLHPESAVASGGLHIQVANYFFLPIDTRATSPLARASLLDDSGRVGKAGTELWIAWRAQLHGSMRDLKQYAGVSLTTSDTDDSRDTFFGRLNNRDFVGVQFNFEAAENKGDRPRYALDWDPNLPGDQAADADGEVHRWVVQLTFTESEDHVRVWIDVPLAEVDGRQPSFSGSRDQVEFDRIRLAVSESSDPWTFDEVMMAASLDDLVAAERMISKQ